MRMKIILLYCILMGVLAVQQSKAPLFKASQLLELSLSKQQWKWVQGRIIRIDARRRKRFYHPWVEIPTNALNLENDRWT